MALARRFFQKMRDGEVVLTFQPIVFARKDNCRPLYFEALLRCAAPDGGYDSCGETVQLLERLCLIERLDASVLWTTIQLLQRHPEVRLGCNLSALSLRHSDWWQPVMAALRRAPGVARRLTLEIIETASCCEMDEAPELLQALRGLGCRIALDDLGVGFSTQELAEWLRPDIIKLDKSLVHGARVPSGSRRLLAWVKASRRFCRYVVAEGVESAEDLHASVNAGAQAVQGYFIGRPSLRPAWLSVPAFVDDFFKSAHGEAVAASRPSDTGPIDTRQSRAR